MTAGKIYDNNHVYLASRVQMMGSLPVSGGSVVDDPEVIINAIQKIMADSDFIIMIGGVSVGAHDYIVKVGEMMEARLLFHGIDMKSGSPVLAMEKTAK